MAERSGASEVERGAPGTHVVAKAAVCPRLQKQAHRLLVVERSCYMQGCVPCLRTHTSVTLPFQGHQPSPLAPHPQPRTLAHIATAI